MYIGVMCCHLLFVSAPPPRMNGHSKHIERFRERERAHGFDATSSVMTSDIDTTSFFDSEDDASSR